MPDHPDPTVTLRMPLSSWRGIVRGLEKWVGEGAEEIELLSEVELVDGHPSTIWWLNGYYEDQETDDA